MAEKYEFETKIHKTTDKKKLSNKQTKNYDYGTISIRSQKLAKYIGKTATITVKFKPTKV